MNQDQPAGVASASRGSRQSSPPRNGPHGKDTPSSTGAPQSRRTIVRQDDAMNSPLDVKGRRKSHINESGDLVPANPDGAATAQQHVRGSEPRKQDSPYTSFSDKGAGDVEKTFENRSVTVDIDDLRRDIDAGLLDGVEIIEHDELMRGLRERLEEAVEKYRLNPSEKANQRVVDRARDVENAETAKEVLIKGTIPKKYLQVE